MAAGRTARRETMSVWPSSSIAAASWSPSGGAIRAGRSRRRSTRPGSSTSSSSSRALRRNRHEYERLTGYRVLPAIELEDGTFVREESDELVARIHDGRLGEKSLG